jgi:hypothetical protein
LNQWRLIWLCAEAADPNRPWVAINPRLEVTDLGGTPTANYKRRIGAWSNLNDTVNGLQRAIQRDMKVTYPRDYPVDPDFSEPPISPTSGLSTNGVWILRGARAHFPPGHAAAVFLRTEVKADLTKPEIIAEGDMHYVQCNISCGNNFLPNGADDGAFAFRGQTKGTAYRDNPVYGDMVEVVIPPGANQGLMGLYCQSRFKMSIWASGFELKPS